MTAVDMASEARAVRVVPREFDEFYRGVYQEMARALALAVGDVGLGTEATDEAFTRAYERWWAVQRYRNPAGWVYRVGLNWATSVLRKRKREVIGLYADRGTEDAIGADPALDRALAELKPKHRSVVVMRYYLDWSIEEMAEALGVPTGTVKSRLHRAMAQLEKTLKEQS